MSISGCVPRDFQITSNVNAVQYPYAQVVTGIELKKRIFRGGLIAATVPCVVNGGRYQLNFSCDLLPFIAHFPATALAQKDIQLLFVTRSVKTDERSPFDMVDIKQVGKWEINTRTLKVKGSYSFAVAKKYCSSKTDTVLDIGLKVHGVVLSHLMTDVIVLSHSKQISSNYELAVGKRLQELVQQCFWYTDATFIDPPKRKKEQESSDSVECEEDEEESLPSRHGLTSIIRDTESCLNELRRLDQSDKPTVTEELSTIAGRIFAVFGSYLPQSEPSLLIDHDLLGDVDFF